MGKEECIPDISPRIFLYVQKCRTVLWFWGAGLGGISVIPCGLRGAGDAQSRRSQGIPQKPAPILKLPSKGSLGGCTEIHKEQKFLRLRGFGFSRYLRSVPLLSLETPPELPKLPQKNGILKIVIGLTLLCWPLPMQGLSVTNLMFLQLHSTTLSHFLIFFLFQRAWQPQEQNLIPPCLCSSFFLLLFCCFGNFSRVFFLDSRWRQEQCVIILSLPTLALNTSLPAEWVGEPGFAWIISMPTSKHCMMDNNK